MTTLMRTEPTPTGELIDHLNLLKIKEMMLMDLDNQIEEHVTDDNLKDEINDVGQYQDSIVITKSHAERILSAPQAVATHASHKDSHQALHRLSYLSKLDLPKFSGDQIRWPEF